ncbi:Fic/DOC family protein [Planococcus salinarum]|uniref:Fic/DOC family protein n=1 Tax=Planococcus salinarum TaxID=622695 RepID=UPI000E3ECC10|nr:Fic family protein [Planococcus salinarum]TAA73508.1 cell filamentation protein Fic [Planococcus salinarum]
MSRYKHSSMYCYPGSDVLINHFSIKDDSTLKELETVYSLFRLSELKLKKPADPVDLAAFMEIHRSILQDVYPFAGQLRQEMISKGSSSFAHPDHIEGELHRIFNELAEENYLKDLPREAMVKRLAHYLAELNALHPFREGNGRTVREFARQLTADAGYQLDWEKIARPAEIINAFVDSFNATNDRLEELLDEIIKP